VAPAPQAPQQAWAAAVRVVTAGSLQVSGGSGLRRVRQLKVAAQLAASWPKKLETLAGRPGLAELWPAAGASGDGVAGVLDDLLMQLGSAWSRWSRNNQPNLESIGDRGAKGKRSRLLASALRLPLQSCARSGVRLEPRGELGSGAAACCPSWAC